MTLVRGVPMKRFRLSTLLLLVIIAALIMALLVQNRSAVRREAELDARVKKLEDFGDMIRWHEMNERRIRRYSPPQDIEERPAIEPMEVIKRGKR